MLLARFHRFFCLRVVRRKPRRVPVWAPASTVGEKLRGFPAFASTPAAATVISTFGVVTYLLMRAACDQFYAPLGLSPEDVGIGQAELLGRSLGVFVVAASLAAIPLALWLEVVGLRGFGKFFDKIQARHWVVAGVASLLLLVVMWKAPAVATGVLVAAIVVFGVRGVWKAPWTKVLARAVGVGIALIAVLAAALLVLIAGFDADRVREGGGLTGLDRFLVPWEAEVVEVRWYGEESSQPAAELLSEPPEKLPCAVFLGSHDGFVVLVDPRPDHTLRLRAGDVTLTTFAQDGNTYPVCEEDGVTWVRFDEGSR